MVNRDGQSRQFGFVGYRTVADAQAAVKYFNRSFMGAQRVAVEFAQRCVQLLTTTRLSLQQPSMLSLPAPGPCMRCDCRSSGCTWRLSHP